jgi:hypothetical protein
MPAHSLHVFDRNGKTLFTKRFVKEDSEETDPEQLSDQRKLVFGMLFSLRETAAILAPTGEKKDTGLHSVKTGASTAHIYETTSGLRFALYVTNDPSSVDNSAAIRTALQHIYDELWIQCVIRSPLYTPTKPNVEATNFEQKLSAFLLPQSWFR